MIFLGYLNIVIASIPLEHMSVTYDAVQAVFGGFLIHLGARTDM